MLIAHHLAERFRDASQNTHRHASRRQALSRLHEPSPMARATSPRILATTASLPSSVATNSQRFGNSRRARPIPRWHSSLHAERIGCTLTVLTRARELIGDEQHWCRRTYARGWRGLPVPVQSSAAHRFCAVGALLRAGRELGLSVEDARNVLEWQTVRPVQDWNDDPARTHREVIAAFDAAVTALEKSAVP